MFPAAIALPHITGGEPCGVVDPGQQEQLAQVIQSHADGYVLLGILPKLRHDQAGGVSSPGPLLAANSTLPAFLAA